MSRVLYTAVLLQKPGTGLVPFPLVHRWGWQNRWGSRPLDTALDLGSGAPATLAPTVGGAQGEAWVWGPVQLLDHQAGGPCSLSPLLGCPGPTATAQLVGRACWEGSAGPSVDPGPPSAFLPLPFSFPFAFWPHASPQSQRGNWRS